MIRAAFPRTRHRQPADARLRRLRRLAVGVVVLTGAGFSVVAATDASAAAGCQVKYTVNQWGTGFTGDVVVTNLGDPVSGWALEWDYAGDQKITQSWSSAFIQAGRHVTLSNAAWNGALATNASVQAGFTATFLGTNAAPTAFTLNGVACTGPTGGTPAPSTTAPSSPAPSNPTPSSPAPSSPAPSSPAPSSPATSAPATSSPTPGGTPTTAPTGDPWNPPAKYVGPLAANWQHQEDTYSDLYGFRNYLFDQVMAGNGSINYCVRWESTATVSTTLRDQVQATVARQFQKWVDALNENGQGWNLWPYKQVPVKVVGWAVRDRNQLQWSDSSVDIYVNDIREGAPQCGEPCGRFFHQDGNYSGCPGGAAHHYDLSLWLTEGMGLGGAGGDWGQRIDKDYFVDALAQEDIHILLHEMGHSWGLNDFYDYDPLPSEGFVMKAGSATKITEFDKWMLRDFWRHLKNRYGL